MINKFCRVFFVLPARTECTFESVTKWTMPKIMYKCRKNSNISTLLAKLCAQLFFNNATKYSSVVKDTDTMGESCMGRAREHKFRKS